MINNGFISWHSNHSRDSWLYCSADDWSRSTHSVCCQHLDCTHFSDLQNDKNKKSAG